MVAFKLGDKFFLKLEAVVCLAWARFLVKIVPFRWWRSTLGPLGRSPETLEGQTVPQHAVKTAVSVGRIVTRIADRMPFEAVCLPQAMAGRWMLRRRGIATQVMIGCRRGRQGEEPLLQHAWLLAGDRIVTGQHEADTHRPYLASGQATD